MLFLTLFENEIFPLPNRVRIKLNRADDYSAGNILNQLLQDVEIQTCKVPDGITTD
jgi:hypothetical protein